MSQLLEFKTKPFEAIHFRQSARLVSADALTIEKQKTLARKVVFTKNANAGAGAGMKYTNKVNNTFSHAAAQANRKVSLTKPDTRPITAPVPSSVAADTANSVSGSSAAAETQAMYTQQRGTLEVRVASGDVAYIPAIEMTIITSWPEVDFTYTGGFHYVPPLDESSDQEQMNLTI